MTRVSHGPWICEDRGGGGRVRIGLVDGWVDGGTGGVHRSGPARLRGKELRLLVYLASRPGVAIGREELYEAVWGYHPDTRSRTLDTTVRRLREAIESDPGAPRHVVTAAGVGYTFVAAEARGELSELFVADRVRDVVVGVPTVVWGPPGSGRSFWLRATGVPGDDDAAEPGPGLSTSNRRPRAPGVRGVEVVGLPDELARALIRRRLAELGRADLEPPADVSAYDGLPVALMAAADRADLTGRFDPPGPTDPLQARYSALVGSDAALGAVGSFPGVLAADVVGAVVGDARLREWVDRGYVHRVAGGLRVLTHAARAAPVDPALRDALAAAFRAAFLAEHDPSIGSCTTIVGRARAAALAPHVVDPSCRVRVALVVGATPPPPVGPDELVCYVLATGRLPDGADLDGIADPTLRSACGVAVTHGQSQRLQDHASPDPADRSLAAAMWDYARGTSLSYEASDPGGVDSLQAAFARVRGRDLLEARIGARLGQALVYAGRIEEARHVLAPLPRADAQEHAEILIGELSAAGAANEDAEVRRMGRIARDLLEDLPVRRRLLTAYRVSILVLAAGDSELALSTALIALSCVAEARVDAVREGRVHLAMGCALLERGEVAAAHVHLARAVDHFAGRSEPREALARAYVTLALAAEGRPDAAAAAGALACATGPDRVSRLVRLALAPWRPVDPDDLAAARAYAVATRDDELGAFADLAAGGSPDDHGPSVTNSTLLRARLRAHAGMAR